MREAIIAARKADAVILCIGINPRMEGEEGYTHDMKLNGDKDTIMLPNS